MPHRPDYTHVFLSYARRLQAVADLLGPEADRLARLARTYTDVAEACEERGLSLAEANELLALLRSARALYPDTWADEEGCWADVWSEAHGEYLSCDKPPDPESPLGLCIEHQATMSRIKRRPGWQR